MRVQFNSDDLSDLRIMSDTVRFLSADMVQAANSGHPGAPMGLADVVSVLSLHLRHSPKNPKWLNRDRIVFSGGHTSAMIYSLLHLWGYELSLEELKNFRQFGSKTPGHPEFGHTKGIEITTGPLGQGVANAVGFAMASKYAASLLNSKESTLIDHKVYCLCGDGDLEEGISYEACSLAGHHNLNNLILIYDSNNITIEGSLKVAFSEDIGVRFLAQGWSVSEVDGHDFDAINSALELAKSATKPTLIIAKTVIAQGSKNLAGYAKTHGAPLGEEEIRVSKEARGFDPDVKFAIPEAALIRFRNALEIGEMAENEWNKLLARAPKEKSELLDSLLNPDFSAIKFPEFATDKPLATRSSNGEILNAISRAIPGFIGGSADLAPSNNTELKGAGDFPNGKNFHFGIREHSMAAINNAIANYGLFMPFCATFFVFSDYLSPAVRVASIMRTKCYYIWTHDSIGVGEDGATHQPIEQLSHFRAMPNLYVFRPADANENIACWQKALNINAPCAFVLSRQNLPVMAGIPDVSRGGYTLLEQSDAEIVLLASGSEVSLAMEAAKLLKSDGIIANVVSVPCFDLLIEQDKCYIDSLFGSKKVLAIEASRGLEWYRFADDVACMSSFGASAPASKLFDVFGFSSANVVKRAKALLGR
ncbi:MAG: transketolase [Wolinella sp.]